MKRIQWLALVVLLLAAVIWPCGAWAQTPTPTLTPTPIPTSTPTATRTATATPTAGGSWGRYVVTPVAYGVQRLVPPTPGARTLAWTPAEVTWFNSAVCTGNEILLVWNTHAGDAGTVTVTGATDAFGRTASIASYSLAAGEMAFFGPLRSDAFRQTDGKLWFAGSAATVKFAVIRLP